MNTSSKPLLGVLLVLFAGSMLATHDGFSKYLTQSYPIIMVVWLRYLIQTLVMALLFAPKMGWTLLKTRRPWLQLSRSLSLLAVSLLFISGLRYIPLGEATAVIFLAPLIVTVLSAILLREPVSKGQWTAVILGFFGVLFIVRPGGELFTPAILLPFSAAFCFALYQLITRKLASTDHALTSNFLSGLFGSVVLLLILPGQFTTDIADIDLVFMLILGVLAMTAHILITIALQYATAATLAPFTYGQIVFAGLVGYVAFAHVPDIWAIVGVVIISLSGLTVAYLQHQQQLKDALD